MDSILLVEVTRENWRAALDLDVHPEQLRFIANSAPVAAIALAKAYIRPGGLVWTPYAFSMGAALVGFTMVVYQQESTDNYWLYHFFIDQRYQGRGYGKEALRVVMRFIRERHPQARTLRLTVHPENIAAQRLYTSIGFQPTGATLDDESVYGLSL